MSQDAGAHTAGPGNMDARRILALALSPSAIFWLFTLWVLWYVTWAVWSKEAFATFVGMLKSNALLQGLFLFGLANAGVNLARGIRARLKHSAIAAAAWAVLPLGGIVFALGVFMSAAMRDEGRQFLGTGGELNPPWQRESFVIKSIDLALKEEVSDIEYSADPGLFFVNEPRMSVESPEGKDGSVSVGSYPPVRIGGTYYHILNYGLAPGMRLTSADGAIIDEAFVISNILPPGNMHSFEFANGLYRISIAMEPVRVIEKGDAKARIYNLKNPLYKLIIMRGQQSVFDGTARDEVLLSDGARLELVQPEPWVRVEASTGEGLWLLSAGLVLIIIGIPLSLGIAAVRLIRASRAEQLTAEWPTPGC